MSQVRVDIFCLSMETTWYFSDLFRRHILSNFFKDQQVLCLVDCWNNAHIRPSHSFLCDSTDGDHKVSTTPPPSRKLDLLGFPNVEHVKFRVHVCITYHPVVRNGSRANVARRKEQQRSFFAEMEGNIRTKIGQGVLFGGATPPSMPSTPAGRFSLSISPVSPT